ncbi:MAG: glycosyltransferase, partial [Acidimicrobiales bacterium]
MRILVVANQVASVGGLERCQLEISRELARRGHGIDLLHVQTGDLLGEWMSFATSTQQVRPFVLDRRALLASPGQLLSAVRAGRRPRPDIVYVHRYQDALLGGLVARSLGHRAVCHLHLPPPKSPSLQVTLGMRQMALCIAVSTHTAESWQPWGI